MMISVDGCVKYYKQQQQPMKRTTRELTKWFVRVEQEPTVSKVK